MASHISSPRNPVVAAVAHLHRARGRRDSGTTLLEGPGVVAAAAGAGVCLKTLFVHEDDRDTIAGNSIAVAERVYVVSDVVMRRLAESKNPRGPVAVVDIPESTGLRAVDTVVCVGVSDPGNMGTLVRSAAAFGFDVATTSGSADAWSPKVLRAGAGGHFSTNLTQIGDDVLPTLRGAGLRVVASVAHGRAGLPSWADGPIALLIGNETAGLSGELVGAADDTATIPTTSVESLNAAVAGSILMWARSQARERTGG